MGVLRATESGLLRQGRACEEIARPLISPPAPNPGPAHQATAAAVANGHDVVESAAKTLARGAAATGAKVRSAAARYASTDDGSAGEVAAAEV